MPEFFLKCHEQEQVHGPFPPAHIRQLAATGRITPTWWIGKTQDGPWLPAARVGGLFPAEGGDRPAVVRPTGPDPSLDRITAWVRRVGWASLATIFLAAAVNGYLWALVAGTGSRDLAGINAALSMKSRIMLVTLPVTIGYGILFLVWVYKATSRLRERPGTAMRFTPDWAVGSWFVPVANFFKPYQAMYDVWRASHGSGEASAPLVTRWWAVIVAGNVVFAAFIAYVVINAARGRIGIPATVPCAVDTVVFALGIAERLCSIAIVGRVRDAFRRRAAA